MNQQKQENYRKMLLIEKSKLEQELVEIEKDDLGNSPSDFSGENVYTDGMADVATSTFEREKDVSLERNVKDLLNQVNFALERIDMGIYGTCEVCSKEIEEGRLEALPYTTICIKDKEKEEAA